MLDKTAAYGHKHPDSRISTTSVDHGCKDDPVPTSSSNGDQPPLETRPPGALAFDSSISSGPGPGPISTTTIDVKQCCSLAATSQPDPPQDEKHICIEEEHNASSGTRPIEHAGADHDGHQASPLGDDGFEVIYPGGLQLALLTFGLCMATFTVALDNTIIGMCPNAL